jgi:hypothetical protein
VARAENRLRGKQPKLAEPAQKSPLRSGGRNTFGNELNLLASGFPPLLGETHWRIREDRVDDTGKSPCESTHDCITSASDESTNTSESEGSSTTTTSASSTRPPANSSASSPSTTNPTNHKTPSRRRANCERCPESSMNDPRHHAAGRLHYSIRPRVPHNSGRPITSTELPAKQSSGGSMSILHSLALLSIPVVTSADGRHRSIYGHDRHRADRVQDCAEDT